MKTKYLPRKCKCLNIHTYSIKCYKEVLYWFIVENKENTHFLGGYATVPLEMTFHPFTWDLGWMVKGLSRRLERFKGQKSSDLKKVYEIFYIIETWRGFMNLDVVNYKCIV